MFCDLRCGNCLGEDAIPIPTIRVDLTHLTHLNEGTAVTAVRTETDLTNSKNSKNCENCAPAEAVRATSPLQCRENLQEATDCVSNSVSDRFDRCELGQIREIQQIQSAQHVQQAQHMRHVQHVQQPVEMSHVPLREPLEVYPEGSSPTASDGFHEEQRDSTSLTIGDCKVAKFLERHGFRGVNVPKRSILSSTYALHKAAEMADQELVAMLLAEGADPLLMNSSGKTAADVAKKKDNCGSHADVFNLLVDARTKTHPKLVAHDTS